MNGVMDDMVSWYPIWQWQQNAIWLRKLVRFIADWVAENPVCAWIALGAIAVAVVGVAITACVLAFAKRIPAKPADGHEDDSGSVGK